MTTTGELLATLSGLPNGPAIDHLVAITTGPQQVFVGPVLAADSGAMALTADIGLALAADIGQSMFEADVSGPALIRDNVQPVLAANVGETNSAEV